MNKKIFKFLLFSLGVFAFTGCSNSNSNNEKKVVDSKKTIYTSFYPIYDFTKKIVGDKLNVVNIVPSGVEPHDYELTPKDRKNLENSDAIFYNGLHFENWIDDLKSAMKDSKTLFLDTSSGALLYDTHSTCGCAECKKEREEHEHHCDKCDSAQCDRDCDEHDNDSDHNDDHHNDADHEHDHHHHHHDHDGIDPHIWLNPKNAKIQFQNIYNEVIKLDPDNKDYYEKNFKKYSEEFDKLDSLYREKLLKYSGLSIVVSHEAFAYLCAEYGLKQVGIQGIDPDSEPSPQKMAEVIDFVKKNNVKVIYFEELVSPKLSESIAKQTGAKCLELNPLEGLTEDEIKNNEDYFSIMRKNLDNLLVSFE